MFKIIISGLLAIFVLSAYPEQTIELYVGQQNALDVPGAGEISIAGGGGIAKGRMLASGQVLLSGVSPGIVTMTVSYKDGRKESFSIHVVARDMDVQTKELQQLLGPLPGVTISRAGQQMEVKGTISSEEEEARLTAVAARYPDIINLVRDLRHNRLIQLDVKIAEVNLSDASQIGVDWFESSTQTVKFTGGVDYKEFTVPEKSIALGEEYIPGTVYPKPGYLLGPIARLSPIAFNLDFLVQKGVATILARPKLVCHSGDSADFKVGGQVPFAEESREKITVEWKPYGTQVIMRPEIVSIDGSDIEIDIMVEISGLDWANQVKQYPSIVEKKVKTKLLIKEKEMMAIAGLISQKSTRVDRRLPFIGSIPIIGRLFTTRQEMVENIETVILITPSLVTAGKSGGLGKEYDQQLQELVIPPEKK